MAKLSHNDSRRMYSWWWDSHISPKNSKWLQENLTDMDAKVKSMIKLIEEDADSFARRAEMYYKKRPELMKMVEEFYRAYRALAERYDHATGVIRQAHRTMSEACPDHFPMMFGEDSPGSTMSGTDLKTPDLSLMDFTDESEAGAKRKVFGSVERVRRGLNFDEVEENEQKVNTDEKNGHVKDHSLSKSEKESESDEIVKLKKAIASLEAEKEAGLVQYQQSLNKLSQLEAEISKSREDFTVFNDRAKKAEDEVIILKESLSKAETEKESNLHEYQQCLDTISKCNERANAAESEVESLKGKIDKLSDEKEAALSQYMQSLETVSNLENKLRVSEEDAQCLKERAEIADSEIETLKQTISKLIEEKEAAATLYQQCLEKISALELKLACAEEEAKRLNEEIDNRASKLKGAEEQCLMLERSNQSLHTELETLMLKMGTQNQELSEKQKELGRLWASIQEERLRFVEAETAFQTLQLLHAQTQEELRVMAFELQNRAELLKTVETQKQILQDEVLKIKEENKNLDEINVSSALSIKDMQNEISNLIESKGKLEQEVEIRVDQRNALQQEIYCLKEEVNDLNKKHMTILDQVHDLGLEPESIGSSVKELREENSNLKETCQRESSEKADLLKKLLVMDQLLEKNSLLETSLSDLNAELEAVRSKIEALEQSCASLLKEKSNLLDEKATLIAQLEETNKNLEKVSENNTVLVNSLSDANDQLEALKARSKILEDSCQLLVNEKADLVSQNDGLTTQLKMTQTSLEELEKSYKELEGRCSALENEKESNLRKVKELEMNLDMEKRDHASYVEMSKTHLSGVEAEMHNLQEECLCKSTELDQMLANVIDNEIELFVLNLTCQKMKENSCCLLRKNQKLLEETELSEKTISKLEKNNLIQKDDIESLSVQLNRLRTGNVKLLEVADIAKEDQSCKDKEEQDQVYNNLLVSKLQEMKEAVVKAEEENLLKAIDFSVIVSWIKELKLDLHNIEMEKYKVELEVKELKSKLKEGDHHNGELMSQIDDLNRKLFHMQETCELLQKDSLVASEEKRSLMDDILKLQEKNDALSNENDSLAGEVLGLENFSLIFRSCADEKLKVLKELENDVEKLCDTNAALLDKLSSTEEKLEESKIGNSHLKEILHKSENEFNIVSTLKDQMELKLKDDILKLQEKNDVLSNENDSLSGKVLGIENFSFIFRSCADEKFKILKELGIEVEKLRDTNAALSEKLSFTEQRFEESKIENHHLKEILQNTENEFNAISTMKDQMELELKEAKKKISVDENEKLQLNKNLTDLTMDLSEVKLVRDHQGDQLHKLSADHELINSELKMKINEINELETEAASIFGQLQYFLVTQLLYEEKLRMLQDQCLGYIDQNEALETQLAAYGPEIASLRECIMSLENHTDIHIKFQDPQNEKEQVSQAITDPHKCVTREDKKPTIPSSVTDLHDLCVRLEAIVKSAVEIKEQMLQENITLQSKLDNSTRQLELLQSGSSRSRRHHHQRPPSEITEEGDNTALLTKDIVLDQVSDGSSYGFSKRDHHLDTDDQIVELWESRDLDGTVGLKIRNNNNTEFRRVKSLKQKSGHSNSGSDIAIEKEMNVDKLEISKRSTDPSQETNNKRKVLERLDSDVQKLANLQITVRDLKRILEVTEKGKRGKAVIECEAIKGQLEEADIAVMKLFDLNKRLTKNIEDGDAFLFGSRSSFDLDGDEDSKKKRMLEQARRMSEKIGRLSMEIQKLQFVLLKMDDENKGKNKMPEARRRILLRDYLYGGGRTGERRKKTTRFCACVQPSTVED